MAVSGELLIVQRALTTAVFKLVRLLFITVQRVVWWLNGTARLAADAQLPENYERCAHVLDIIMQHQFDILHTFTFEDFICTSRSFVSPAYIRDNDHISLLTVSDHDAIFVEARQPDMLLWKSKYSPFIRNAQVENCRRLIVVPLLAFHRMSEELGDHMASGRLVFLLNAGRCGSTLLTHMAESTGSCVAISEPDALNVLATRYRRRGDSEELRCVMRDSVRWLCRPYRSFQPPPAAYVLKVSGISSVVASLLTELFPDSRFIYMYRDPVKIAQSAYRAGRFLPSLGLTYIAGRYSATLTEMAFNAIGFAGVDYHVKLDDNLTLGIYITMRSALAYLDLQRRHGFPAVAVRYEDLLADPVSVCREVFEFCGLPASRAETAVETLNIDSQRNTPVSRDLLGRIGSGPQLTKESLAAANKHLKKFGLPLLSSDGIEWLLAGTIGRKGVQLHATPPKY